MVTLAFKDSTDGYYQVELEEGAVVPAWALSLEPCEVRPPPVTSTVPSSVSRFQARAALLQAGLLDDIEAFMALPETDAFTRLAWEDAQEFNRQSPMVSSIGALFGLTDSQLDDLFMFSSSITA